MEKPIGRRQFSLACATLPLFAVAPGISQAHGLPRAQYMGLTATALDLGFEIFYRDQRVNVYVTDHDSPFDTKIFAAEIHAKGAVILLHSEPNSFLRSAAINKNSVNLKTATLIIKAAVLPEPVILKF